MKAKERTPLASFNRIDKFDRAWARLDARLITVVLGCEIASLFAWVALSGLSTVPPPGTTWSTGVVFRMATTSAILGTLAWRLSPRVLPPKAKSEGDSDEESEDPRRSAITTAAILLGLGLGYATKNVGVAYFANVKSWLQEGSTLTLFGGLRGVATRLTLWLALLGGALATSAGKHIHVDVVARFLPERFRLPVAITNLAAAALVCFSAAWGFVDQISLSYGVNVEATPSQKIGATMHGVGEHAFFVRKQIGLDLRTLPRVLVGSPYETWQDARTWNAWVKDGFSSRYSEAEVAVLLVPDDGGPHPPLVALPSRESPRGLLLDDLSLVVPFGLGIIGVRMLLRLLLTISGHRSIDPDEAHKDEDDDGATKKKADATEDEAA